MFYVILTLGLSTFFVAGFFGLKFARERYHTLVNEIREISRKVDRLKNNQFHKKDADNFLKHIDQRHKYTNELLKKESINLYRQMESLLELGRLLPDAKLHNMRGWAFSPDALLAVLQTILEKKPNIIIELGSGVSTVAISELIEEHNLGCRLLSIDHLEEYMEATKSKVSNSESVSFVLAELKEQEFKGLNSPRKWYDITAIQDSVGGDGIDMVIIDGPPESTQKNARMPAFFALIDLLNKNATVILDDYSRNDEKEAVRRWSEFSDKELTIKEVETEKGLAVINVAG